MGEGHDMSRVGMTSTAHDRACETLRIASLVPSLTELLFALGLGPRLVARTGYCIHPAEQVRQVPRVGGTKAVNLAKLRRLAPTHVLLNVDENTLETVDSLRAWGPEAPVLVITHPQGPQDNLGLVDQLVAEFGHVDGVREHAAALTAVLHSELELTKPAGREPLRVLYLIWHDPWMTVSRDTYISRMLSRICWHTEPCVDGGHAGAARYPVVLGSEPWLADVERVLLSSEPFAFGDSHVALARALCPNADVLRVDGERLSWYGVRAVAGLRYLRDLAGTTVRSTS